MKSNFIPCFMLFVIITVSACSDSEGTKTITVNGITLKESTSILLGGCEQLNAAINPPDASNQNLEWKSDNEITATVSSNGLVTANSVGSAVITATTDDGGFTASCSVTVSAIVVHANGVSLNRNSLTIREGIAEHLTATISPINCTNQNLIWSSSDKSKVTVDSGGLITANAVGDALITVTTVDGGFYASCSVTVTSQTNTEGPSIEVTETDFAHIKKITLGTEEGLQTYYSFDDVNPETNGILYTKELYVSTSLKINAMFKVSNPKVNSMDITIDITPSTEQNKIIIPVNTSVIGCIRTEDVDKEDMRYYTALLKQGSYYNVSMIENNSVYTANIMIWYDIHGCIDESSYANIYAPETALFKGWFGLSGDYWHPTTSMYTLTPGYFAIAFNEYATSINETDNSISFNNASLNNYEINTTKDVIISDNNNLSGVTRITTTKDIIITGKNILNGVTKLQADGKIIVNSDATITVYNYNQNPDRDGTAGSGSCGGGGGGGSGLLSGTDGTISSDWKLNGIAGITVDLIPDIFQEAQGGNGNSGGGNGYQGGGGRGAGAIYFKGSSIEISGKIYINGYNGGNAGYDDGGGGGGSAGELMLEASDINFKNLYELHLYGGIGGLGSHYDRWTGGYGGYGANGYLKLKCNSVKFNGAVFYYNQQDTINTYITQTVPARIVFSNPNLTSTINGLIKGSVITSNIE